MAGVPAEFAAFLAADPACRAAADFKNTFMPRGDTDYGWAAEFAKERYTQTVTDFKELDDKAAAVINYLASGAGLLTIGSLAAVATAKLSPMVIAAAAPSVACATLAIAFAAKARKPTQFFFLSIKTAARYADYFRPADRAKAAFLGQWHLCVTLNRAVLARKAAWLKRSMQFFVAAVACLLLPLVASLLSPPQSAPPPVTVNLVTPTPPDPPMPPAAP
jgi:hypothetical protein